MASGSGHKVPVYHAISAGHSVSHYWLDGLQGHLCGGACCRGWEGCCLADWPRGLRTCSPGPGMSDQAIMELNLPTGIPIVYELDQALKPTKPMRFLGDEETVRKAMEAVAAQGKAK